MRQTSIWAYGDAEAEGILSRMRAEVYEALKEHGPMSGSELNALLDGPSYHKRLSELERMRAICPVRIRMCRITGRQVLEWAVANEYNPVRLSKPRLPKKAVLRAVVKELEELLSFANEQGRSVSLPLLRVVWWLKCRSK